MLRCTFLGLADASIHALIPKVDFKDLLTLTLQAGTQTIPVGVYHNQFYVPLRSTLEALGYDVSWNAAAHSFTMTQDSTTLTAAVESIAYTVNGKKIISTSAPILSKEGTAMLPVSALSEVFGLSVNWSTSGTTINGVVSSK